MPFLSNAIIDVFHVAGLDLGHHGWRDIASLAKLRLRHRRRLPHARTQTVPTARVLQSSYRLIQR